MKIARGIILGCVLAGVWGFAGLGAAQTTRPASGPAQWILPLPARCEVIHIDVSADARHCSYSASGMPEPGKYMFVQALLDLQTARATKVEALFASAVKGKIEEVTDQAFSPDGQYLAAAVVLKGKPPSAAACVVRLKGRKVTKVAQAARVHATWVGRRLYVGLFGADGSLTALRRADPAAGKTTRLPFVGLVLGPGPEKDSLLALCKPDALDKPISRRDGITACHIAVLSGEGKVVRKITPQKGLLALPSVSAGGLYCACTAAGGAGGLEDFMGGGSGEINVFDLRTGKQRTVKAEGATLQAVTDDGRVLATRRGAGGKTLVLIGPDGKSRELAKGVQAVTVAGGRIYYVTAADKGVVLKALPLPKAPATAPSQ